MGLRCWVKCQSCSKAVLIVQLRDHQSSPGRCIVTVWVLTCFINQSYWIARCYFYSHWHDLPARGLTSWWARIDPMLRGRKQSGEPTIISPRHTHTHGSVLCTPTHIPIFWHGLSHLLYVLWGLATKQWHTSLSCFFPNPYLSTSHAFIMEQGNTG